MQINLVKITKGVSWIDWKRDKKSCGNETNTDGIYTTKIVTIYVLLDF